jgi:hypothetical protein
MVQMAVLSPPQAEANSHSCRYRKGTIPIRLSAQIHILYKSRSTSWDDWLESWVETCDETNLTFLTNYYIPNEKTLLYLSEDGLHTTSFGMFPIKMYTLLQRDMSLGFTDDLRINSKEVLRCGTALVGNCYCGNQYWMQMSTKRAG